jgi:CubicO group peptidase (beta-lactamase class C family)
MPRLPSTILIHWVLAALPAPCVAQALGDAAARADALFAAYAGDASPGLAAVVIRRGETVFTKGYGRADLARGLLITPQTVFDAGSLAKQVTGLAVAMLIDDGTLSLDSDVRSHIPELDPALPRIAVRELVHHTSGLRDFIGGLRLAGRPPTMPVTREAMLDFVAHQRSLNFAPGTEYSYSNTNYSLLAEIVQRVSGMPFHEFVATRIFRPLGMRRTRFSSGAPADTADRAPSYALDAEGRPAPQINALTVPGSSSLLTTADDLARWVRNLDDAHVGGRAALTQMQTAGYRSGGARVAYGFGVELGMYRNSRTVEHTGAWAGYTSAMLHFPATQSSVVVLTNLASINPRRAARDLADLFLGDSLGPPDSTTGRPARRVQLDADRLDRYIGAYRLGPAWYLQVRRDGLALRVRAAGEPEAPAEAQSDSVFWVRDYASAITFSADSGSSRTLRYRDVLAPRVDPSSQRPAASFDGFAGTYDSDELRSTLVVTATRAGLHLQAGGQGEVRLSHVWGDEFRGSRFPFTAVTFLRDASGTNTALSVFVNDRNRNVLFRKRATAP